jgi:hypothetical protein
MTWAELKQQARADFKEGRLSFLAFGILVAILNTLEREGFTVAELSKKALV